MTKQILASNYSNAESSAIHSSEEKEHNVSEKKVNFAVIPQDSREEIIIVRSKHDMQFLEKNLHDLQQLEE